MRHDKPVQAQVAVVYAGRSLFFDLPADTLKADLAILLASFGRDTANRWRSR